MYVLWSEICRRSTNKFSTNFPEVHGNSQTDTFPDSLCSIYFETTGEQNLESMYRNIHERSLASLLSLDCTISVLYTPEPVPVKMTACQWWLVVILTGSGLGNSGMYRTDPMQTRDTKLTKALWLSLLFLPSMFGGDFDKVQVMVPQLRCP